jgi:Flp pilus assembly pilin Flp
MGGRTICSPLRGIGTAGRHGDVTAYNEAGGAATPRCIQEDFPVTALAPAGPTQKLLLSTTPQLRRRRAARRALTARKEVNQVLKLFDALERLNKREDGQTMAEYGVVLAVITIAVFGALALLSGNIVTAINRVAGYVS